MKICHALISAAKERADSTVLSVKMKSAFVESEFSDPQDIILRKNDYVLSRFKRFPVSHRFYLIELDVLQRNRNSKKGIYIPVDSVDSEGNPVSLDTLTKRLEIIQTTMDQFSVSRLSLERLFEVSFKEGTNNFIELTDKVLSSMG